MSNNNYLETAPYHSVFVLYLLISCNFLAQLFSCNLQKVLNENMFVKHIFGFFTMLFCIILVDPRIQKESRYAEGIIYTIIFYIWFWATTKTKYYITVVIFILLLILYILQLHKNNLDKDDKQISKIKTSQTALVIIALIITIFGFINYYNLKSKEYNGKNGNEQWSNKKFFIGVPICKKNSSLYEM